MASSESPKSERYSVAPFVGLFLSIACTIQALVKQSVLDSQGWSNLASTSRGMLQMHVVTMHKEASFNFLEHVNSQSNFRSAVAVIGFE